MKGLQSRDSADVGAKWKDCACKDAEQVVNMILNGVPHRRTPKEVCPGCGKVLEY